MAFNPADDSHRSECHAERFQQIQDLFMNFCLDGKLDSSCGTNLNSGVYFMDGWVFKWDEPKTIHFIWSQPNKGAVVSLKGHPSDFICGRGRRTFHKWFCSCPAHSSALHWTKNYSQWQETNTFLIQFQSCHELHMMFVKLKTLLQVRKVLRLS